MVICRPAAKPLLLRPRPKLEFCFWCPCFGNFDLPCAVLLYIEYCCTLSTTVYRHTLQNQCAAPQCCNNIYSNCARQSMYSHTVQPHSVQYHYTETLSTATVYSNACRATLYNHTVQPHCTATLCTVLLNTMLQHPQQSHSTLDSNTVQHCTAHCNCSCHSSPLPAALAKPSVDAIVFNVVCV